MSLHNQRENQPRNRKKAPVRRKKRRVLAVIFIFAIVIIAAVAIQGYTVYQAVAKVEQANTFYPGVYVNDVSLYGATPQEAFDYLVAQAKASIEDWHITLWYGENNWEITPDMLGMNSSIDYLVQQAVNNAFLVGRSSSSIWERYRVISDLKENPYRAYTADAEKTTTWIEPIIEDIVSTMYVEPVDATLAFDATRRNPVVITSEVYGQQVDADALRAQINAMVSSMEAGVIQVQAEPIRPNVVASDLENKVVLLANYESPISTTSTENRILNIERGCEAFNAKVIQPGEKVSFNTWVGKRTAKNGFYEALEIANGEYRTGYGGGICQVSTALYNAVIQANLQVDSRRNHGLKVNYVDMGADATVYDDRIDFVFTNNTGEALYMLARVEPNGKRKQCVFQIYGRPDPNGYKYSLRHVTLEEIPIPEAEVIEDRKQQYVTYTDETYVESEGAKGYKVETYLVVKDSSGSVVSETSLYVDTYKAQTPKVYVGIQYRE